MMRIRKLHHNAQTPTYATDGSACFDLYAVKDDYPNYLHPEVPLLVRTGLAFEVPVGYVMLIFSRSGHGFNHDTRLSNCVGVIDSDYRGEVMVKLTRDSHGPSLAIKHGSRIAQALLMPVQQVTFEETDELSETERGTGGFGSTGA